MNPSQRWIEAQKAMPSFVAQRGEVPTVLDQPMPAHLQAVSSPLGAGGGNSPNAAMASPVAANRSMTPPASTRQRSTATAAATTPRRSRPIHEDLLEKGRLYREVQEARREKALRQEQRRCRSVPKISKMGHNIERSEDIVKRLYRVEDEKKQLQKYKMMEIDMKEKKVMDSFFSPRLSKRGERAQGSTMELQHSKWEYKRQERLEELRRKRIMEEMNGIQETPDINPRSEKLAAQRREKEGLAGYSHAESMLERDRLSKLAKWELQQSELMKDNPGNPRITEYAAMLDRDGNIGERLMREGAAKKERLAMKQREKEVAEASTLKSPTTNVSSQHMTARQTPRGNGTRLEFSFGSPDASGAGSQRRTPNQRTATAGDHYVSTGDEILDRHNRYYQKRDEKIKAVIEMEKKMHVPAINPVSDQIAAKLPQTARERLMGGSTTPKRARSSASGTSPTPSASTSVLPTSNPYEYASASTSPVRQANTPTRTKTGAGPSSPTPRVTNDDLRAYERMRLAEERKQHRIRKMREELEEKEKEELTFKPQTNTGGTPPAKRYVGSVSSSSPAPGASPSGMYDRAAMWARKRDEKLAKARQEQEEVEDHTHPFSPTITSNKKNDVERHQPHDAGIYGGSGRAWGFDEYVDRQDEARRRAEERQRLADRAATSDTGYDPDKLTKPVGPKLGAQRDVPGSLRKPVEAPGSVAAAASPSFTPPPQTAAAPHQQDAASPVSFNWNDATPKRNQGYPTSPSQRHGMRADGYPAAPNATPAAGPPQTSGATPDPRNLAAILMGASPLVAASSTAKRRAQAHDGIESTQFDEDSELQPDELGGGGGGGPQYSRGAGGVSVEWRGLEHELDDDEVDNL